MERAFGSLLELRERRSWEVFRRLWVCLCLIVMRLRSGVHESPRKKGWAEGCFDLKKYTGPCELQFKQKERFRVPGTARVTGVNVPSVLSSYCCLGRIGCAQIEPDEGRVSWT